MTCTLCGGEGHLPEDCPLNIYKNKKTVDISLWEEYSMSFVKRSSLDQLI